MGKVKLALGFYAERPYGDFADSEKGRKLREKQLEFISEPLQRTLNGLGAKRTFFILGDYLQRCLDFYSENDLREIYDGKNILNEIQQLHCYLKGCYCF